MAPKDTTINGRPTRALSRDSFLEELRSLECAAGIAPLLPEGVASTDARIGYVLRRQRALRALTAKAAFERLPAFWQAVFLLSSTEAERYCRRLGRRLWDGPERAQVPESLRPFLDASAASLADHADLDVARGLVVLTALWVSTTPAEARPAAGIARSTVGSLLSSLAVDGAVDADVGPVQAVALELMHSFREDRSPDAGRRSHGGDS